MPFLGSPLEHINLRWFKYSKVYTEKPPINFITKTDIKFIVCYRILWIHPLIIFTYYFLLSIYL